jgi:flagellar protein FliO/FliZ
MKQSASMRRLTATRPARLLACGLVIGASFCLAQLADAADTVPPPSAVGAGSMLQFGLGLAIVLGLIVAAGWFMKRFSLGPSASGLIKIVAGVAVGQRERVVVVEIGETWMVLGVSAGRVNPLHTMPRGNLASAPPPALGGPASFATWLKDTMEKRRGG